ncbi:MAG TPA: hypothetical protein VEH79_05165 [Gaiellaceae bacterium]|nr:hypothetical protein [Gaiellaceae bacterium]
MRRCFVWLTALPLMLTGSLVAHVLAYRWAYPSSQVRLQVLLSTGHGYMDRVPLVLGITTAAALVSLAVCIVDSIAGRSPRDLPPWAFALLPLVMFTVQEILERSLHTGTFFWQAVESPTFLPGLVLQLPFAAVACLVAWLLLRTARAVGQLVGSRRTRRTRIRALASVRSSFVIRLPRLAPLAAAAAGRAPPRPT